MILEKEVQVEQNLTGEGLNRAGEQIFGSSLTRTSLEYNFEIGSELL